MRLARNARTQAAGHVPDDRRLTALRPDRRAPWPARYRPARRSGTAAPGRWPSGPAPPAEPKRRSGAAIRGPCLIERCLLPLPGSRGMSARFPAPWLPRRRKTRPAASTIGCGEGQDRQRPCPGDRPTGYSHRARTSRPLFRSSATLPQRPAPLCRQNGKRECALGDPGNRAKVIHGRRRKPLSADQVHRRRQ